MTEFDYSIAMPNWETIRIKYSRLYNELIGIYDALREGRTVKAFQSCHMLAQYLTEFDHDEHIDNRLHEVIGACRRENLVDAFESLLKLKTAIETRKCVNLYSSCEHCGMYLKRSTMRPTKSGWFKCRDCVKSKE